MWSSHGLARRKFYCRVFGTFLSTLLSLVGLDIAVGLLFSPPDDPRVVATPLQAYFDYGRSIEGKLRRMVGPDDNHAALITKAGWLSDCDRSTDITPGKIGVETYGNSFSIAIAEQMEMLDPKLAIQNFGGPGASPNYSYACFVRRIESGRAQAPIQIIGVLASSIRRMLTSSGLTTSFEQPQPFTYPRYTLGQAGDLVAHGSSIETLDEFRSALNDPVQWRAFLALLAASDVFFAPEIMSANVADRSVILRMICRAWGRISYAVAPRRYIPKQGLTVPRKSLQCCVQFLSILGAEREPQTNVHSLSYWRIAVMADYSQQCWRKACKKTTSTL